MSTSSLTQCPNCNASLKTGIFSGNALLVPDQIKLLNAMNGKNAEAYCLKCGEAQVPIAFEKLQKEIAQVKKDLYEAYTYIPVISAQNPMGWDYRVLNMVTAQTTTGTGVLSEITSSFSDFFGTQSDAYNQKLKNGEQLCFAQLRKQVLELGGNAVIATDIDYSEVGGDKGMLMVCMAGTAVILNNPEVLGDVSVKKLEEIKPMTEKLKSLHELKNQ